MFGKQIVVHSLAYTIRQDRIINIGEIPICNIQLHHQALKFILGDSLITALPATRQKEERSEAHD